MKCTECVYYWSEDGYETCHWESKCPGDIPPCEEDDAE